MPPTPMKPSTIFSLGGTAAVFGLVSAPAAPGRAVRPGRRPLTGLRDCQGPGGQKLATSPVVHDVSGRSNPIAIARGRKTSASL